MSSVPDPWLAINRAGECFLCGYNLRWYDSKYINRKRNLIACPFHTLREFGDYAAADETLPDFVYYTDG